MNEPRRYLKIGLIIIFSAIVIIYALYQARYLLRGPIITITKPTDGQTVSDPFVTILGSVKNAAYIYVNDLQSFIDADDNLVQNALLSPGYNMVTVKARDRFGRERTLILRLFYKETATSSAEMKPETR